MFNIEIINSLTTTKKSITEIAKKFNVSEDAVIKHKMILQKLTESRVRSMFKNGVLSNDLNEWYDFSISLDSSSFKINF